jgi:hypothetical protein
MKGERLTVTLELPPGALVVQAAPPELLSQRTSEAMVGVPRLAYLASLPSYRAAGGEVLALGRLRLVRRAQYVAWLAGTRIAEREDQGDGTAALAHSLGLRLVAAGGRQ